MRIGYIGIDTGKSSGAIFWNCPGSAVGVIPFTTGLIRTIEFCRDLGFEPIVTIEAHNPSKHHGMIKCYGAYKQILGQAEGTGVKNIIEVQSKTWQKFIGFIYGEDTKRQSIKAAKEIYPGVLFNQIAKNAKIVVHDLTDAGCICEYGRRVSIFNGN